MNPTPTTEQQRGARKKQSPSRASCDELTRMYSDNCASGDYWLLVGAGSGSHVYLCHQKRGQPASAAVSIPRGDFNRIVRWYLRPQKLEPKKKGKP